MPIEKPAGRLPVAVMRIPVTGACALIGACARIGSACAARPHRDGHDDDR
jgi:hypothetical protein